MKKHKTIATTVLLTSIVLISIVLLISVAGQSRSDSKKSRPGSPSWDAAESQQMPITPYDARQTNDRAVKSARFNQPGGEVIDERVQSLPLISHWWWGLSAFPVERSDAVVIGEVVRGQAYLSGDRTSIYSEFTVNVEEVLKADATVGLSVGDSMNVQRHGGGVQFASGRIHYYRIAGQNLPRVGHRYLLFLTLSDPPEDFTIVTGYELRNGRVSPLDDVEIFASYDQFPETELLKLVRGAVNPHTQKDQSKRETRTNENIHLVRLLTKLHLSLLRIDPSYLPSAVTSS